MAFIHDFSKRAVACNVRSAAKLLFTPSCQTKDTVFAERSAEWRLTIAYGIVAGEPPIFNVPVSHMAGLDNAVIRTPRSTIGIHAFHARGLERAADGLIIDARELGLAFGELDGADARA